MTSLRWAISEVAQSFAGADLEAALLPTVAVFTARTGLIPAVTAAFQAGEVDLAVVPDLPAKDRLLARRLMTERYCLVTPKSAVPTDNRPLADLGAAFELPFVSYRTESLDWQKSQRMLRLLGLSVGRSAALENTAAKTAAYEPHLTLVHRVFTESLKTRWLPQMTALKPAVADYVSV